MKYEHKADEQERWRRLSEWLIKEAMFRPSCIYYWYSLANNRTIRTLNQIADKMVLAMEYAKYYYRDYPKDLTSPAEVEAPDTVDVEKDILYFKGQLSSGDKVPLSREEAIDEIEVLLWQAEDLLGKCSSDIKGLRHKMYSETMKEVLESNYQDLHRSNDPITSLRALVQLRAAKHRASPKVKGEGASFTIAESVVSCSLEGDPVQPELLGIQVGDIVNDTETVTAISGTTFTLSNSLESVSKIESAVSMPLQTASTVSYAVRNARIPELHYRTAAEFQKSMQAILDLIEFIDVNKVPVFYRAMNLTLKGQESLVTVLGQQPRPPFTRKQQIHATNLLSKLAERGFGLAISNLVRYRITQVLTADSEFYASIEKLLEQTSLDTRNIFGIARREVQ